MPTGPKDIRNDNGIGLAGAPCGCVAQVGGIPHRRGARYQLGHDRPRGDPTAVGSGRLEALTSAPARVRRQLGAPKGVVAIDGKRLRRDYEHAAAPSCRP
jgi:hypothetical protein